MTCEEAATVLYEYLDKELDQETVALLEKHLELCKTCCDHFDFEKKIRSLIQEKCTDAKAPQFLKNKILNRLNTSEL